LRNIFVDDFEGDNFFLFKRKIPYYSELPHFVGKGGFVEDSLKMLKEQTARIKRS